MVSLTLIVNPSYVCHNMKIFWPASSVKLSLYCWTEFSQSWKDLRKRLEGHENLESLTDLSGANFGIDSNSRDWLFWMFMMSKINPLMNKSVLFSKDVWTAFSIFIKNRNRNTIPKYEHITAPHVLGLSSFTRIVQTVLCWFHRM